MCKMNKGCDCHLFEPKTKHSEGLVERVVMCESCPECGCYKTNDLHTDALGDGYRVCNQCKQEWYTDVDYEHHIAKRHT